MSKNRDIAFYYKGYPVRKSIRTFIFEVEPNTAEIMLLNATIVEYNKSFCYIDKEGKGIGKRFKELMIERGENLEIVMDISYNKLLLTADLLLDRKLSVKEMAIFDTLLNRLQAIYTLEVGKLQQNSK